MSDVPHQDRPEPPEGMERVNLTEGKLWVQVVTAVSSAAVLAVAGWLALSGGVLEIVAAAVLAFPAVMTLRGLYLEINGRLYGRPREPDPELDEAREAANDLKRTVREELIDPWAKPLLKWLDDRW